MGKTVEGHITPIVKAGAALVHAATHENGGADEISVAGLSGELADDQPPKAHKASHENGGADELSVAGLSGLLADGQTPLAHKTSHQNGGSDELNLAGLSGLLADDQHVLDAEVLAVAAALVHAARHENAGADEISLAGLSGDPADTINKSLLTTRGDILFRNATVPARLAKGTWHQFLKQGQYAPEWTFNIGWHEIFMTHDTYTTAATGTASVSWGLYDTFLKTGATSGSTLRINTPEGFPVYGNATIFRLMLQAAGKSFANSTIWARVTRPMASLLNSDRGFGWKVVNGRLYAWNGNGTNHNLTDTGLDFGTWTRYDCIVEFKLETGTIKYYVGGVLKATHTTYITNDYHAFQAYITNTAAADKRIRVRYWALFGNNFW